MREFRQSRPLPVRIRICNNSYDSNHKQYCGAENLAVGNMDNNRVLERCHHGLVTGTWNVCCVDIIQSQSYKSPFQQPQCSLQLKLAVSEFRVLACYTRELEWLLWVIMVKIRNFHTASHVTLTNLIIFIIHQHCWLFFWFKAIAFNVSITQT